MAVPQPVRAVYRGDQGPFRRRWSEDVRRDRRRGGRDLHGHVRPPIADQGRGHRYLARDRDHDRRRSRGEQDALRRSPRGLYRREDPRIFLRDLDGSCDVESVPGDHRSPVRRRQSFVRGRQGRFRGARAPEPRRGLPRHRQRRVSRRGQVLEGDRRRVSRLQDRGVHRSVRFRRGIVPGHRRFVQGRSRTQ